MLRRLVPFLTIALLAMVVLAACGGDDDDDDDEDATREPAENAPTVVATTAPTTAPEASPIASPAGSPAATPIASDGAAAATPVASPAASPVTVGAASPAASSPVAAAPPAAATPVASPAVSAAASPVASPVASPAASPVSGGQAAAVTITMGKPTELDFDPPEITIAANTDVTFTLPNEGVLPHNFSIDAFNVSVDADPGATQETTVNAAPGEYEFYCAVPGHKEGGMVGTLIVQ